MDCKNDIVLFSSESFFQYACQILPECKFLSYPTIGTFFQKMAQRKFNRTIELDSQSRITDFYEFKSKPISAFWIVEQTPYYVSSIKKTLVLLRWMGFKQPVIISSFRELTELAQHEPYNLPGLFTDYPFSEKFIRLPVRASVFMQALSELISLENSTGKIGYLKANSSLLDHDLCKYPYSRK